MPDCPACKCHFQVVEGRTIPWDCPACSEHFIARYGDLQLIAAGSAADIYKGRDYLHDRRPVAIKVAHSDKSEAARRIRQNIQASKRLTHENIVKACAHGEEYGLPYLVTEFVPGTRLDRVVDHRHPLPSHRVVTYLRDVAAALDHAQQKQVINRTIKPSNILITPDDRAKILDYGSALIVDPAVQDAADSETAPGAPAYSAPEQFIDPNHVTIAADVYSLGCTIFFCLTRQQPFSGLNVEDLQRQHTTASRPSIRQIRPDVPKSLDDLVHRMMAVSPDRRPQPAEIRGHIAFLLGDCGYNNAAGARRLICIKCPSCGQLYRVEQHALRRRMRCHKPNCPPFDIEPHLIVSPMPRTHAEPHESIDCTIVNDGDVYDADWVRPDEEPKLLDRDVVWHNDLERESRTYEDFRPMLSELAEPYSDSDADSDAELPAEGDSVTSGTARDTAWRNDRQSDTGEHADITPMLSKREEPFWDPDADPAVESTADGNQMAAGIYLGPPTDERLTDRTNSPRHIFWVWALVGTLSIGSAAAGWTIYKQRSPAPNVVWQTIVKDEFSLRHWADARKSFEAFQRDFATDPNAAHVPFFIELCNARLDSEHESPESSLKRFQALYHAYRDKDVYDLYVNYIYDLMQDFVKRLVEEAGNKQDLPKIRQAWTAFALYSTVAKSMKDDWVADRVQEIETLIKSSERRLSREAVRNAVFANLIKLHSTDSNLDPDMVYASVDNLKTSYPELGHDRQLIEALQQAEKFEVEQVTYERADERSSEPNDPDVSSNGIKAQSSFLLLLSEVAPSPVDYQAHEGEVFLALARGVLYVFDGDGSFLWARRLGLDSDDLPVKIEGTSTRPSLLLANSTQEGRLLALEARTGRLHWSYKVDGDILAAPMILSDNSERDQTAAGKRALLPMANGDIHVLETILGKRLGTIRLHKPLATGGTYDHLTKLAYFPAEHNRVFAIDPAIIDDPSRVPCRSLLFTSHAGASLRSEPIVAGPYLILNQATDLDSTLLQVFRIHTNGFGNPHESPLKEERLEGWTWHAPIVSSDRLTLVTDRGDIGAFGINVNREARDEEAIYRLIDTNEPVVRDEQPVRSLVVDARDDLLCMITSGKLQKLSVDVVHQTFKAVWPTSQHFAGAEGIPVQGAQMSADRKTMYLNLMSSEGGSYAFSAVDAERGTNRWRRELGHSVLGDPIVQGDGVHLIDYNGQIWRIKSSLQDGVTGQFTTLSAPVANSFASMSKMATRWYFLGPSSHPSHVAAVLDDGQQLAIMDFTSERRAKQESWKWSILSPRGRVVGQPCLVDGRVAVPCDDGLIELLEGTPNQSPNPLPTYPWRVAGGRSGAAPMLCSAGEHEIVLIDNESNARRLQLQSASSDLLRWSEVGNPFKMPNPHTHPPVATGDGVYLADGDGILHCIHFTGGDADHWQCTLPGSPSTSPRLFGRAAVVILESRRIACIDPRTHQLKWVSDATDAPICGQPTLIEGALLVVDESPRLAAIGLNDGRVKWRASLPVGTVPASAAVPFGPGRFLIPLTDGTLLVFRPSGG